ncbi:2-nitropropane dioxygenase [Rhizodiscina lignyota]|uniref:2-nitropropane dioxygenase n=1 Tax=Rhizodiscina lignyota TaxID=1504668 RepID=A0A9P4M4K7_9PEZI|nr:2-nitropropane dioxygenase [Rhizodiscina lignyota]
MSRSLLKSWFPHCETPVISNAPMFGTAIAPMAAAVTNAGGLGFIGGGFDFKPESTQISSLDKQLTETASLLGQTPGQALNAGVGFITFDKSFANFIETVGPVLAKHKVAAVWLFAPTPSKPSAHAPVIPALKEMGKSWGLKVFVMVGTVEAAREAMSDGADVLVVQGVDAGGHQWAKGSGIISVVPEVCDMLKTEYKGREVAVVAAGGIMDGRGIAAAMALGAEGVVMGTRFVATKESPTPDSQKAILIEAEDGGATTIKDTVHDDIQSTGFWPPLYDGRAMILDSYNDHKAGMSLADNVAKYKEAAAVGDNSRRNIWAGTGIGLIKDIPSSADVVKTSLKEVRDILGRL